MMNLKNVIEKTRSLKNSVAKKFGIEKTRSPRWVKNWELKKPPRLKSLRSNEKIDAMGCKIPETKEQAFERKKAEGFFAFLSLFGCGCFLLFLPVIVFVGAVVVITMKALVEGNY